ncbi:MAG: sugar ABC transporter substrate-binding protein [Eubacteriales bacterium]|nr:sugar ABC transporter substrate-binding protein [Eubacteriales bacterium]
MKMKRTMALLMAGVMGAGMLAGCGNSSSKAGSAASNNSDLEQLTFVIAARDEFMSTIESNMQASSEDLGFSIITQDAQNDAAKQIQYIETAVNGGARAVICLPVDADGTQSLIDAAGEANLVFVNRPPTNLHELAADNVCYVGSDEDTSGYYQGEYLAEYFKAEGKKEVKYIMIQGTLGNVSTTKRSAGVIRALEDNGIKPTEAQAPLVADWDRPTAQEMVQPLVASIDYDCIISNNDAMALGAIEACKDAGVEIDFPIVGIDCTKDGAQAIVDGTLAMTVFQNPQGQGIGALTAAYNLINGNPINQGLEQYDLDDDGEDYSDSIMWIPFEPVTTDNVADYM